jgi:hypothetical protein
MYIDMVLFHVELKLNSSSQVQVLEENLKEIAKDPENCSITTSLPPNLLLVLEDIRNTLQNQNDAIKNAATLSKSSVDDKAKGTETETEKENSRKV